MASETLELRPIDTLPGVQPITDDTNVKTQHYTYADKIRFEDGAVKKIGGWLSLLFDYSATVNGTIRTIFTDVINGKYYTVLGTNTRLYALIGSRLTNITPLKTTSDPIANSLDTHYDTLANNPVATVLGSRFVTITDPEAALFIDGDTVTLSGVTGNPGGIPDAELNVEHVIRSLTPTTFVISVTTAATSTTAGAGGAAVVRSSGLVTVNYAAHGQEDGDRVKIEDAATFGGILDTEMNREFIIRNLTVNTFDVMTIGTATSAVSASGGAATIIYQQIDPGNLDEGAGYGYGAGFYGAGLYGTALLSTTGLRSYPRIWFADRYGDTIIVTPGNQGGLYQWQGNAETAPELIPNAPTAINYAFVSDNIIVTLGAGGIENRVFASDQNDITVWTSSSTNQVFDDDIEGASRLISHCPVSDYNLIFTEYKTYTFRYIGLPFVWEVKELDATIGLISPMARVNAKGIAFWQGLENFYMFRGGTVEVVRANSQSQSTCLDYIFKNLNFGQKSKCFAWYNKQYNEVWFHSPSAGSNECDRAAAVNVLDFPWMIHNFDRTAAEYPNVKLKNPRLANVGTLYQHEFGVNADGDGMEWTLTSDKRFYNKNDILLKAVVPDSVQTGNLTFTSDGYRYPQSVNKTFSRDLTITPTTERVPMAGEARFYQFTWSSSALDQEWIMGRWFEEVQIGSPK